MASAGHRKTRNWLHDDRRGRLLVIVTTIGLLVPSGVILAPLAAGTTVSTSSLSVSPHDTLGVAADPGREAFSWGSNDFYGQLGDGSMASRSVPGAIADGANESGVWITVTGGSWHGCAISADDSAYCWGDNSAGQLGNVSAGFSSTMPVHVTGGPTGWESLAGGRAHTCGVGDDSDVYCWGWNIDGQLGIGTNTNTSVPTRVTGGPTDWEAVSAGNRHTCAVGADARAFCWGEGDYGQLGNGSMSDVSVPVQVGSGLSGPTGWKAISAGNGHTCGIAIDDSAYCWGNNGFGELGNATTIDDSLPVRVTGGPSSWLDVVAGASFTCGLGVDLRAYCWGWNRMGQLGNGANVNVSTPVQVDTQSHQDIRMIATDANAVHACGVSDDSVYCWGGNWRGQLGNGSADDSSNVPVSVALPGAPVDGRSPIVGLGNAFTFLVGSYSGTPSAPVFTSASPSTTGTVGTAYPGYTFAASGTAPITFSKASGTLPPGLTLASTGVLSGTPTTAGTYTFTVTAANGINPDATTSTITISISPVPGPGPAVNLPPSAPLSVTANAGDASAMISWASPTSSGSFPVTHYKVQSSPGNRSCLVTAPARTCTITGLSNGTGYTFTVRALNGAGWGAESEASDLVTPRADVAASIVITGSRDARSARYVRVAGTTTGLVGENLIPWMRFPRERQLRVGAVRPVVASDGTFTWSRRSGKAISVYFSYGDVKSNTVVIRKR